MNALLCQVKEVTLLSAEEWEEAVATVPNIPIEQCCRWWTRSPTSYFRIAAIVERCGSVNYDGTSVNYEYGIRPVFNIPYLLSISCKPGDKITVGTNTRCTVIKKGVVLADNIICRRRFDPDNNNYENSEIKKCINSPEFFKIL